MEGNDGRPSRRLVTAAAVVIIGMWVAAGARWLLTGDVAGFALATGSFTLLCGYLFGVSIVRKAE